MNELNVSACPEHIFRAYDVRGRVEDELTPELTFLIGQAFANEASLQGTNAVVVGGDVRLSTDELKSSLAKGLQNGGVDVIDIGTVPTPVVYFAVEHLDTGAGIVVTGSHNPPEYNGLKFVLNRIPFAAEELRQLSLRINQGQLRRGSGTMTLHTVEDSYVNAIVSNITIARPMRIGIDCGNGATSLIAPRLFEELQCITHALFAIPDGTFPNHHPDPVKLENLSDLIELVQRENLDLGIAFDGDGDRLGVVTRKGNVVPADTIMLYFAKNILEQQPGAPIVFDVKCGGILASTVQALGGDPVVSKTGHTHIKQKLRELAAPLGGEFSGHLCFADRWYGFDDALYSTARLLELLSQDDRELDDLLDDLPPRYSTPEIEISSSDRRKFHVIDDLQRLGSFGIGKVLTIDGVRVEYPDGWGLIRASNTSPKLTMRFEATSPEALDSLQKTFIREIKKVAPDLF